MQTMLAINIVTVFDVLAAGQVFIKREAHISKILELAKLDEDWSNSDLAKIGTRP